MTHVILNKASEKDFEYDVIYIDINMGTYMNNKKLKASDTSIRVNKQIYGERHKTKIPMSIDEVKTVTETFNKLRESKGWPKITFRCLEDENV